MDVNNNELKAKLDNQAPPLPPREEKEIFKKREWARRENAKVRKDSLKYRPPSSSSLRYKKK